MKATDLLCIITETLIKNDQEITLGYDAPLDVLTYDLNVGLKSDIKLHIEDEQLIARMRYGGREVLTTVKDLLNIYDYWFDDAQRRGWGKMTVPSGWVAMYEMESIIVPKDTSN